MAGMVVAGYGGEPTEGALPMSRDQLKSMIEALQRQCVVPVWTAVYQTLSSSDWKEDSPVSIVGGSAFFADMAVLNAVRKGEAAPDSAVMEVRFVYMGKKPDLSRKSVMRFYSMIPASYEVVLRYEAVVEEEESLTPYLHFGMMRMPYGVYRKMIEEPLTKAGNRVCVVVDGGSGAMMSVMASPSMAGIHYWVLLYTSNTYEVTDSQEYVVSPVQGG